MTGFCLTLPHLTSPHRTAPILLPFPPTFKVIAQEFKRLPTCDYLDSGNGGSYDRLPGSKFEAALPLLLLHSVGVLRVVPVCVWM